MLTSIVLLEGKPSGRLRFWMLWTMFSLRPSIFLCIEHFFYSVSPSVPASDKQPHSMRLLPAHFTFGMVIRMWLAVPAFLQTWCLELRFIRQDTIIFKVWGSFRCFFCKFYVFSCVYTEERIESCHTAINPRSWSVAVVLSFCRFLLSAYTIMELNYSDCQVIRHHSNQSHSPSVAQFSQL